MASQSISFRPEAVIKNLPWSVDKKAALGSLLIIATLSLIGWLYLGQASIITSSTLRIDHLRQDIDLLTYQNNELLLEIAQMESISTIESRAIALGYGPTPPERITYLNADLPTPSYEVATNQSPAFVPSNADILSQTQAPPQQAESLWQTWLNGLTAWITGQPTS